MTPLSLGHFLRRASMPAAAAAVLVVAGCGGGSADTGTGSQQSQAPDAVVLTVSGTEYSFTPSTLKASAGKTTIRFTNKGAVEHDFTVGGLGVRITAQPGKTAQATVTLKPGTYKTHCSVIGHSQSGMNGTLTVS